MTAAPLEHVGPWNEEDYFELGQTTDRIELLDGSLIVSPVPSGPHQQVARRLTNALKQAADRVVTMQLYALAGIRWYLLAQVEPVELRLFRLDGRYYVEHALAAKGEALRLTEPFPAALDTTLLTR